MSPLLFQMHKTWHYHFAQLQYPIFQRNLLFEAMILKHLNLTSVSVLGPSANIICERSLSPRKAPRIPPSGCSQCDIIMMNCKFEGTLILSLQLCSAQHFTFLALMLRPLKRDKNLFLALKRKIDYSKCHQGTINSSKRYLYGTKNSRRTRTLYIPSTLNIDYLLWHTQLFVCAVKYQIMV